MKKGSAGGRATAIILRSQSLERYYRNPNLCKNCGKIIKVKESAKVAATRRKVFCNRSCAAIYNNCKYPKRKRNFVTIINIYNEYTDCFENKTKKEVFDSCKLWQTARNMIRKHARKVYLKNIKNLVCKKCGYGLHVDVCHLTPVSKFPDHAFIREINNINNLIGLCPTHHWELDNGYLKF